VAGKEILLKGAISKGNNDLQGVLVAQGTREAGYGLYLQDGKMNLMVRQKGKTYKAVTSQPLPEKFDYAARIAQNGVLSIEIDGRPAAKGKAPALFASALGHTLRSGEDVDDDNRIGDYTGTFNFAGTLQNATLELKKPEKAAARTHQVNAGSTGKTPAPAGQPITINMKVVEHLMQFDKKLVTIKAGQKVTLNLDNPDGMQHNLVIIKPGTLSKVGTAADALARDPNGAEKNYVPQVPEVLWATKLLGTGESATLEFTAPTQPGDYIFVCTFPGHWRGMNGILRVTK
jgi:azurin